MTHGSTTTLSRGLGAADIPPLVDAARQRLAGHTVVTPLEHSPAFSRLTGAEVLFKLENLQVTRAFKARGAMNAVLGMAGQDAAGTGAAVVTASTGNHGTAVAWALAQSGRPGIVFVPEAASPAKLAAIASWGAEIRSHGRDAGATERHAQAYAQANGLTWLSPYDHPLVIGGQGTIAAEIEDQLATRCERDLRLDRLYIAVGGGGLLSGIAGHLKRAGGPLAGVEIVACSPAADAALHDTLAAGSLQEGAGGPTLADGCAGGLTPGAVTIALAAQLIDRWVLVPEAEIAAALRAFIAHEALLAEGSAAMALAALLADARHASRALRGQRVAVVICGGRIAPATLACVLADG